jgi:hypothetical protein
LKGGVTSIKYCVSSTTICTPNKTASSDVTLSGKDYFSGKAIYVLRVQKFKGDTEISSSESGNYYDGALEYYINTKGSGTKCARPNGSTKIGCRAGQGADPSATTGCSDCAAGYYSPANNDKCYQCGSGKGSKKGSASCTTCTALTGQSYCDGHEIKECPSSQKPNSSRTGCEGSTNDVQPQSVTLTKKDNTSGTITLTIGETKQFNISSNKNVTRITFSSLQNGQVKSGLFTVSSTINGKTSGYVKITPNDNGPVGDYKIVIYDDANGVKSNTLEYSVKVVAKQGQVDANTPATLSWKSGMSQPVTLTIGEITKLYITSNKEITKGVYTITQNGSDVANKFNTHSMLNGSKDGYIQITPKNDCPAGDYRISVYDEVNGVKSATITANLKVAGSQGQVVTNTPATLSKVSPASGAVNVKIGETKTLEIKGDKNVTAIVYEIFHNGKKVPAGYFNVTTNINGKTSGNIKITPTSDCPAGLTYELKVSDKVGNNSSTPLVYNINVTAATSGGTPTSNTNEKTPATCPKVESVSEKRDGKAHYLKVTKPAEGGTMQQCIMAGFIETCDEKMSRIWAGTTEVTVKVKGDANHTDVNCGKYTITVYN